MAGPSSEGANPPLQKRPRLSEEGTRGRLDKGVQTDLRVEHRGTMPCLAFGAATKSITNNSRDWGGWTGHLRRWLADSYDCDECTSTQMLLHGRTGHGKSAAFMQILRQCNEASVFVAGSTHSRASIPPSTTSYLWTTLTTPRGGVSWAM